MRALVLILALPACTAATPAQPAAEQSAMAPTLTPEQAVDLVLDGSSAPRFRFVIGGGGTTEFPQELVARTVGFAHFAIAGTGDVSCSLDGVAYTGRATRAEVRGIVDAVDLDLLPDHEQDPDWGGCSDASSQTIALAEHVVTRSRCGAPDDGYFAKLVDGLAPLLQHCAEGRTPFTGDLRYVVRTPEQPDLRDDAYRNAPTWPASLSLDAALAAPATGLLATGEASVLLRAIRDQKLRGEIGSASDSPIPVLGPDGSRHQLATCDAVPLE